MTRRRRSLAVQVWQVLLSGSSVLMLGLVLETEPGPTGAVALVVVVLGSLLVAVRAGHPTRD